MTSIFNTLLVKLQARILAAIPDSVGVKGIRMVDQDLGQIDIYQTRPAIAWPCVLIDFSTTAYQQQQLKSQWAKMNIVLRLAFDPWSTSTSLAPEEIKEKALLYYEIENKLYLTLHDWFADGILMEPMKRLSASSEKRDDFRVRNIVFKATYEDRGLQAGSLIVPNLNPNQFRIDWIAVSSVQNKVQDNRLKGKTIAHIQQVSWEGDDKFKIIDVADIATLTHKLVALDAVAGELIFLNTFEPEDHIWTTVLTN